jgi:hypothetical protein
MDLVCDSQSRITSSSICSCRLLPPCSVELYDWFRAFSIASAQRYASRANFSCACSSACSSDRAAKATEGMWLNNAVRAAAANLSRSSSRSSLSRVSTFHSLVLVSGRMGGSSFAVKSQLISNESRGTLFFFAACYECRLFLGHSIRVAARFGRPPQILTNTCNLERWRP